MNTSLGVLAGIFRNWHSVLKGQLGVLMASPLLQYSAKEDTTRFRKTEEGAGHSYFLLR
jgi:hypothetical protein